MFTCFSPLPLSSSLQSNFYDVPHNIPLPEVEDLGFLKSPPSALLSQPTKFKYLDVCPYSLPCRNNTLLLRDEYKTMEHLIRNTTMKGDIAIIGTPRIGTFLHLTLTHLSG